MAERTDTGSERGLAMYITLQRCDSADSSWTRVRCVWLTSEGFPFANFVLLFNRNCFIFHLLLSSGILPQTDGIGEFLCHRSGSPDEWWGFPLGIREKTQECGKPANSIGSTVCYTLLTCTCWNLCKEEFLNEAHCRDFNSTNRSEKKVWPTCTDAN